MPTSFTRDELIDVLYREYEFLCLEDFDPDVDPTPDEYLDVLNTLSDDELVNWTSSDDIYISTTPKENWID